MKNRILFYCTLALLALFFFPAILIAQGVVDTTGLQTVDFKDITPEKANMYANVLFSALVIVWGYVARALKIKYKPGNFVFIVIAGGIVIGGIFVAVGWAKALPLSLSLLASLGVFDAILRPGQNAIKTALSAETKA